MTKKILDQIIEDIKKPLDNIGIFYRIYSRSKHITSIKAKIAHAQNKNDPYGEISKKNGKLKKMQDLFGIRIVLYFADDIKIVHKILSSIFFERKEDSETHDLEGVAYRDTFKPVRYNIIYNIPEKYDFSIKSLPNDIDYEKFIDSTFEVQIRTTLSEGWYEVEHDLRYKNQDDWETHDTEWRQLNGILAALETNDWAMIQIFGTLAHKLYHEHAWVAMLRLKLRIRINTQNNLSEEIVNLFNQDNNLAKKFIRFDRSLMIEEMNKRGFYYPLCLDNIVYFINLIDTEPNEKLLQMTPDIMKDEMQTKTTN